VRQSKFREAAVIVAQRIRAMEHIELDEAIIEAHGDLVHYLEQAGLAAMAKDKAAFQRNWRDAQSTQPAAQLELPGMEHASLPAAVFDADGNPKPWQIATLTEIKREVSKLRRSVSVRDRVVGGYEATIAKLESLGVDQEMTGAEIEAQFANELEA